MSQTNINKRKIRNKSSSKSIDKTHNSSNKSIMKKKSPSCKWVRTAVSRTTMTKPCQLLLFSNRSTLIRLMMRLAEVSVAVRSLTRLSPWSIVISQPQWKHFLTPCCPSMVRWSAWNYFTADGSSGRRVLLNSFKICRKHSRLTIICRQ
jgi:hypothetical protein